MEKAIRINLLWVVALLLLIIAALLLQIPNGGYVANYISFAASLASLILAVVAIFYSIISNQGFYQSISALTGLAERISKDSDKLNDTSQSFLSRATDLLEEVRNVSPSVEKMTSSLGEKLSAALSKGEMSESSSETTDGTARLFPGKTTVGGGIAVYLLAMSIKYDKVIDLDEAFSIPAVRVYVHGFLSAIGAAQFRGIKLSLSKNAVRVLEKGSLNVDRVIEKAETRDKPLWIQSRKEIKEYFETTSDTADDISVDHSEETTSDESEAQ